MEGKIVCGEILPVAIHTFFQHKFKTSLTHKDSLDFYHFFLFFSSKEIRQYIIDLIIPILFLWGNDVTLPFLIINWRKMGLWINQSNMLLFASLFLQSASFLSYVFFLEIVVKFYNYC